LSTFYVCKYYIYNFKPWIRWEKIKKIFSTDRGKLISAFLEKLFSKYVDYNFTAGLEDQLDEITTGKEKRGKGEYFGRF
jgi:Topoisomerase IA